MRKRRHVYRICAVCGEEHGPTYGFKNVLRRICCGDPRWGYDKAVPSCVTRASLAFEQHMREWDGVVMLARMLPKHPYVCNNFLDTVGDKNTCHICRQPRSAH